MQSLRSRLVYLLMKNRHLLRFKLKRETWDEHTSIAEFREQCERGAAGIQLPPGVTAVPVAIDGVTGSQGRRAEWLVPEGAPDDRAILYTVGGGYVSGSVSDHRALVAKLALGSGVRLLLFDHRLAPEDPYPAAVEDAVAAYQWLLSSGLNPEHILIAGESAGGGLCLATLLALRDQGIPLPSAGVAISPWTDLALTGDSYRTRLEISIDPPGMSEVCSKHYAGGQDTHLPWMSPLYGELRGLPPLFICVGGYESMLDDSTRFAEKAEAAGVQVSLRVWEGMIHCFPLLAPLFPEATQALAEICEFVRCRLGLPEAVLE